MTTLPGLTAAFLSALAMAAVAVEPHAPIEGPLPPGGRVIVLVVDGAGGTGPTRPPPACADGARLDAVAWREALAVGTGLRKQRIRVEYVHAGPGCRARHTAYLVFGADRVHHDPDLAASCRADAETRQQRRSALAGRVTARPPYPDTHLALVVDVCNLRDLAEPGWPACARHPGPGDMVVFEPGGGATPRVSGCVARGTLLEWSRRPEW